MIVIVRGKVNIAARRAVLVPKLAGEQFLRGGGPEVVTIAGSRSEKQGQLSAVTDVPAKFSTRRPAVSGDPVG